MSDTATEILEKTKPPKRIKDLFLGAVSDFKTVADALATKTEEEEPKGVNGNPLIVDPASEMALEASQIVTSEQEPIEATPTAPVAEPAPAGIVEASAPTQEGTTDDVRAPLAIPAPKEPKPPRKPLIDWSKIGKQLSHAGQILGKAFQWVGDKLGLGIGWLFTLIIGLGYLALMVVPAILYVTGWAVSYMQQAFMNGYNREPMMNPDDKVGNKPIVEVIPAT